MTLLEISFRFTSALNDNLVGPITLRPQSNLAYVKKAITLLWILALVSCADFKLLLDSNLPSEPNYGSEQFTKGFANQKFSDPPFGSKNSRKNDTISDHQDWYLGFEDSNLNQLIRASLQANLDVQQAWSTLRQSELNTKITNADRLPNIDLSANVSQNKSNAGSNSGWQNSHSIAGSLQWELDLWKRIKHAQSASHSQYRATRAELHGTYLLISTQIGRTYFNILRQLAIIQLIKQQIETNQQFFNLTKIRKSTGQGSILDLQQQQQRLLTTQAQLPEAETALRNEYRRLAVLLGKNPLTFELASTLNTLKVTPNVVELPVPPILEKLPSPQALLLYSPSLYASYLRLEALNYNLAISAANRLPRLSLNASHTLQDSGIPQPSTLRLSNLAVNLVQPIFNAGALKNTHLANQEALQAATLAFEESYLSTIAEIEIAIDNENYQKNLFANTLERLELAKKSVSEAKFQYANGITDYLNVLLSLETLQQLEIQAVNVQRNLLDSHINIILASGGPIQLPESNP